MASSWIPHSLLPFVTPRPRLAPRPGTLPRRQSQLPPTLGNTPFALYKHEHSNTHTHTHVRAQALTRTLMDVHACMHALGGNKCWHTPADADAHTKDILSHFFGMFPALKKQGRFVITSASAVESVRAGRVRGETTPSSVTGKITR